MECRDLLEALLDEFRPVGNGTYQHTGEDKIELLSIAPRLFEVVDIEGDVRWDTASKKW